MPNRDQQDWQVQKYSDLKNQNKKQPSTPIAELKCGGREDSEDSTSYVCMYPTVKGFEQSPQMGETEWSTVCWRLSILRDGRMKNWLC